MDEVCLIKMVQGGPAPLQGTWVHPDLALDVARWCSKTIHIKMLRLVKSFVSGQVTTEMSTAAAQQTAAHVKVVETPEYLALENNFKKLESEKQSLEGQMVTVREQIASVPVHLATSGCCITI